MDRDASSNAAWTIDRLLTNPGAALAELNRFPDRERDLLEANNRYLDRARKAAPAFKAMPAVIAAATALIDAVTFDDSGVQGRGGNGGLLSRDTIRKADELRLIISNIKKEGT